MERIPVAVAEVCFEESMLSLAVACKCSLSVVVVVLVGGNRGVTGQSEPDFQHF